MSSSGQFLIQDFSYPNLNASSNRPIVIQGPEDFDRLFSSRIEQSVDWSVAEWNPHFDSLPEFIKLDPVLPYPYKPSRPAADLHHDSGNSIRYTVPLTVEGYMNDIEKIFLKILCYK